MGLQKKKRQRNAKATTKRLPLQVPHSWDGTLDEWRMAKRGEWANVVRAIDVFAFGAAYVPAGTDFYQMQRAANRITEAMNEDWIWA